MDRTRLTQTIRELAFRAGFDSVGVAPALQLDPERLKCWLELEYHGEMAYLARDPDKRLHPQKVLEGAKSVVSLALSYNHPYPLPYNDADRGVISRYAAGDDYHEVLLGKLRTLAEQLRELAPSAQSRVYVDTGPVLEKAWAQRGGIGWIGKHTNLIARRKLGSWFFLAELLLNIALDYDQPESDHCGSCTRCIEACPTDAIVAPYLLDSRRCISYLTIELRGDIPTEFREPMGNLIFGCDICQDVCPWNSKSTPTSAEQFAPRPENRAPLLVELSRLSPAEFSQRFRKSPIKRAKRRGLVRNIAIALGNTADTRYIPDLDGLLNDDEPLIRRHAAWGLRQIGGSLAETLIKRRMMVEEDQETKREIQAILDTWRKEERVEKSGE